MGRNPGRQWGDSVAAYGEVSMAAVSERPQKVMRGPESSHTPLTFG